MRHSFSPRRRLSAHLISSPMGRMALRSLLSNHQIDVVHDITDYDVYIVDLRAYTPASRQWMSLLHQSQRQSALSPLIYMVASDQLADEAVLSLAKTQHVVVWAPNGRPLINAIQKTVALKNKAQEVSIRLKASATAALPLELDEPSPSHSPQTLLLSQPQGEALHLLNELQSHGETAGVLSQSQALQSLELGIANGVFLFANPNRRPQHKWIRLLRRQSELMSLPVIVFERNVTERHVQYWSHAGADTIFSVDHAYLASQFMRRAIQLRGSLNQYDHILKKMVFTDKGAVSEVASGPYFDRCLAERFLGSPRDFALGVLRLFPKEGENHQTTLSEAAVYIALAGQPLDLVSRPAPDTFIFSFPNANKASVTALMQSYEQMITDLKFGGIENSSTFTAKSYAVFPKSGDSPQTSLTALFKGLSTLKDTERLFA
ncbi:MAG: hypothetical protein AAF723_07065 [Pseudomonadota bacterium]